MEFYKILILPGIIFLAQQLQAQNCLPVGIIFETQADIDQFATNYPGCSVIDGDVCIGQCLNIVPTDITNLDGLLQLTSIHGNLKISDNASLANLNGLQNLASVDGNMELSNNSLVANLNMTALRIIGGNFTTDHSGLPESLTALERVGGNYTSKISSSKYIGNNTLKYIGGDVIISSLLVDTISGFEAIDTILGTVSISDLDNLKAIDAFHQIKFITYYTIRDNYNLSSINDLLELAHLHDLQIADNLTLRELPDFPSLTSLGGNFVIKNNFDLMQFIGYENIVRIDGTLFLQGTEYIPDVQEGGVEARGAGLLDAFHNLTFVGGDFSIPFLDNIYIVDGFTKLDSIGHNFNLDLDPAMHNFPQSNHFKYIGGDIQMGNLRNLKNLECLNSIPGIYGTLRFYGCDSLLDLNGLEHIKSIGGNLFITSMSGLTDFTGLDSLTEMHGFIYLAFNKNLESLQGLDGIDPMDIISYDDGYKDISIYSNHKLSFCNTQNICDALRLYHKSHWISNNSNGCNGPDEINCSEYSLSGTVFFDANQNKIQDPTEHGIPGIKIKVTPEDKVAITDENGLYQVFSFENIIHTVTIDTGSEWSLVTDSAQYTKLFQTGLPGNKHNDFGIYPAMPSYGLSLSLASEQTRCNRKVKFYLRCINEGSSTISGRLVLTFDPYSSFYNATFPPDTIDSILKRLVWNIDSISPYDFFKTEILFTMPNESHEGESLPFVATILKDSSGSEIQKDIVHYNPILVCPIDPNDKIVMPGGVRDQNYTLIDDRLTYTIRFENTGSVEAIDITVIDTLDSSLDMSTFKVINSNYPVAANLEDHIVTFSLPNIWLPPAGKGFISYEIKPISDVPNLTSIENKASIIFESNQQIVTNTTKNTLVDELCTDIAKVENIIICHGESYLGHTETGVYIDTARIGIFCDSIHQLNLTVRDLEIIDIDTLICEGESFHGYDSAGIYTYESINPLTGCTDVVQLTLGIIPLGESNCTTGSINLESDDLKIYPNPATDEIYIETKKPIESIIITTLDGKKVSYTWQTTNDKIAKLIPGENTPAGLYVLTIISNGHLYNHKIIIL